MTLAGTLRNQCISHSMNYHQRLHLGIWHTKPEQKPLQKEARHYLHRTMDCLKSSNETERTIWADRENNRITNTTITQLYPMIWTNHKTTKRTTNTGHQDKYDQLLQFLHWLWRWLPHRYSKRQSLSTNSLPEDYSCREGHKNHNISSPVQAPFRKLPLHHLGCNKWIEITVCNKAGCWILRGAVINSSFCAVTVLQKRELVRCL